jgi:hypothetical protein
MNLFNIFIGILFLYTTINIAIPDINFEIILIKLFYFYSVLLTKIKQKYNNSKTIRYITKYLHTTYKFINNIKTEPEKLPWINVYMIKGDQEIKDDYSYINADSLHELSEEYIHFVDQYIDEDFIDMIEYDDTDVFFTMKTDQMYLSNIYNKHVNDDIKVNIEKSSVSFISIEYTHPSMNDPIQIVLDKKWYYDGNEILSKTFILRYLKHQCLPYVFTDDYLVNIIDNDINQFTLNKDQYILLKIDGYKIITFGNHDE